VTRALVTGGAGFIGHHLCAALSTEGVEVHAIDDLSTGRRELLDGVKSVALHEVDVRQQRELTDIVHEVQPEWVFHLAGLHFIPACNRDPAATLAINTVGTAALLEALRSCEPTGRVILASTGAVYSPDSVLCREGDRPDPDDIYGQSKVFAEQLVHRFSRETGKSAVVLRLFNVYGPGETNPHVVPEILEQALADDAIRLGNLTPERDYIYVHDVVAAMMQVARVADAPPGTLNVGTGQAYSVGELVSTLARIVERPLHAVRDPARERRVDRPRLCADISLAKSTIGWSPCYDLEKGLRATWESLQS
jgi:UDP-glucose 4-epimerase